MNLIEIDLQTNCQNLEAYILLETEYKKVKKCLFYFRKKNFTPPAYITQNTSAKTCWYNLQIDRENMQEMRTYLVHSQTGS